MADFVYMTNQEYPSITLTWKNSNDEVINFSSGYTWTVILARGGEAAVTKTTGVVGASTAPNVTINWAAGELDIAEGTYELVVVARDGANKDRVFRPGRLPTVQIVSVPTIVAI
jgi:hypothetical protein